jgi:tetratricopeptide (TPR) repeat protein
MLKFDSGSKRSYQAPHYPTIQGSSAHDCLTRGEAAFQDGNLPEAKKCFETALQQNPFNAKIHNNLSVVHWRQGKTEEALNNLTRALELDSEDQDVILNCGSIFHQLGKQQDAREILQSYLAKKPWDREVKLELEKLDTTSVSAQPTFDAGEFFNEQGEQQFSQGKLDHARACFEMAIEHNPDYAKAHCNLGVVYWQEGNLQKALEHLYEALELDSEDTDILYNGSKALAASGETRTAADLLRIYLQHNPEDDVAWEDYDSLLGRMETCAWNPEGLSTGTGDVYMRMGEALAEVKDYRGAGEAFERALQLDPSRVEVFCRLGHLHLELGQKAEALEIVREGLKLNSGHKATVLLMGEILTSLGRTKEAKDVYQSFLSEHDDEDVRKALEDR